MATTVAARARLDVNELWSLPTLYHPVVSHGRDKVAFYWDKSGRIELEIPRDRQSSFDPQLIAKYQRRFPGFDEKIISMYARGMSVREIVGHLRDLYGVDVSPDLISAVTDAVLDDVAAWQARPLEPVYPLVFFDALRVKIRDEGFVRNKAIHIALGVRADGTKEILGLWLEQNEGAKFWLRVMNELRNRGVEDILVAVVDGLKGFPEAILAVFPDATVQTCIVHLIRYSMQFAAWKERKTITAALKPNPVFSNLNEDFQIFAPSNLTFDNLGTLSAWQGILDFNRAPALGVGTAFEFGLAATEVGEQSLRREELRIGEVSPACDTGAL